MDPIAFLYLQLINRLNQRDHVTASQQFTIILTTADVAFAIKKMDIHNSHSSGLVS